MVCSNCSGNMTALGHVRVAIRYSLFGPVLQVLRDGFSGTVKSANRQRSSHAELLRLSSPDCRTPIVEDGNDGSVSTPDLCMAIGTQAVQRGASRGRR
jgi:hypothetical protein